jgi:hypothetical protein
MERETRKKEEADMSREISYQEAMTRMKDSVAGFFHKASAMVSRPQTRELLEYLASDVESQGQSICDAMPHLVDKDALNECFLHARDLMPIFRSKAVQVDDLPDEESILRLAIEMKEGCISFLSQLAQCMDSAEHVKGLNECIMRENHHRQQLWGLLRMIRRGVEVVSA